MAESIVNNLRGLLKSVTLSKQDVLELTECIIQEYIEQQENNNEYCDPEQTVKVHKDDDGDIVDDEGFIYDQKLNIRIGEKDLKTKEKIMYNVV